MKEAHEQKDILILGCGAIGSKLAKALNNGDIPGCRLVGLYDSIKERSKALSETIEPKVLRADSMDEFLQQQANLVVEAASQDAVRNHGEQILDSGKDIMIMSVGALMDDQLYNNLVRKASSKRLKIYIPSGAVAGLDAIRCASRELTELTLTTRKHPDSLTGAPYFAKRDLTASSIMEPKVLYSGPAEEAVRLFPANVNVAAVLSLAGLGPTKTLVNVIADPTVDRNIHEITAKGSFGEFRVTMMNRPHPDNPKTSYIAVLSALETLRQYAGRTVHIGT